MQLRLDSTEFNTILAALRVYAALPDDHPEVRKVEQIAEPEGEAMALTAEEVDDFAEQLNLGQRDVEEVL